MELTTPTGAAILAATVEGYGEIPAMRIEAAGYGAGTRRLDFPNVLRVLIGEEASSGGGRPAREQVASADVVLATNVDDLTPELSAHTIGQLLEAGAQDAWIAPIVMKKGRPAVTINALCSSERADAVRRVLFRETGTLGIRTSPVDKWALDRRSVEVETVGGSVRVKVGTLDGEVVSVSPEYEDVARAAAASGIPARALAADAVARARDALRHEVTAGDQ